MLKLSMVEPKYQGRIEKDVSNIIIKKQSGKLLGRRVLQATSLKGKKKGIYIVFKT